MLTNIKNLTTDELKEKSAEITKGFPNTYTFTKFLAEQMIQRERGKMTVAIVRPTIVGAAYKEPFPGWVDAITALSGVHFFVGAGVLRELVGNKNIVIDLVAVDIVANMIIASAAYQGDKKTLEIYHCGSSSRNPLKSGNCLHSMIKYLTDHKPKIMGNASPSLKLFKNETLYKAVFWIKRKFPALVLEIIGKFLQSETIKDKAALYNKMLFRSSMLTEVFKYFSSHSWIFESSSTDRMNKYFSESDISTFPYDMKIVDWEVYNAYYVYGVWTFIGNEHLDPPFTTTQENIFQSKLYLEHSHSLFGDCKFIHEIGKLIDVKGTDLRVLKVMEVAEVKKAMQKYVEKRKKELEAEGAPRIKEDRLRQEAYDLGMKYAHRIECRMNKWIALSLAFFVHKYLRRSFNKIMIEPADIERLKELKEKDKGPLVFIPNHRSYNDFLIITYILLAYCSDSPYTAASEDFLNIPILSRMFRSIGAFFIQREENVDPVYKAILQEYVKHLLMEGNTLEFYIEGKRTRSGKLNEPKYAMLKTILETYLEKRVPDVQIVPVSISYEKIMEDESFFQEFMGENKKQESLGRIFYQLTHKFENLGSVHVNFGNSLAMSLFVTKHIAPTPLAHEQEKERKKCIAILGEAITGNIAVNQVVTPTEIVASLLLIKKRQSFKELETEFKILRQYLLSKKIRIVRN